MTDGKEIKALINEYKNLYQRHYLAYKVLTGILIQKLSES